MKILAEPRPRAQALADLIEKHDGLPDNHPDRPDLERMIRFLEAEIARQNARDDPR